MANELFAEPLPHTVSIKTMQKEIERELNMRRQVYPRQVDAGKMTHADADRKIRILEALKDLLETLRDPELARELGIAIDHEECDAYAIGILGQALARGVALK